MHPGVPTGAAGVAFGHATKVRGCGSGTGAGLVPSTRNCCTVCATPTSRAISTAAAHKALGMRAPGSPATVERALVWTQRSRQHSALGRYLSSRSFAAFLMGGSTQRTLAGTKNQAPACLPEGHVDLEPGAPSVVVKPLIPHDTTLLLLLQGELAVGTTVGDVNPEADYKPHHESYPGHERQAHHEVDAKTHAK